MFTDELKGNSGRKRAEANRAKRRQLKQKQEAKRTSTTAASPSASSAATSFGISIDIDIDTTAVASASAAPTPIASSGLLRSAPASPAVAPTPLRAPTVVAQEESLSAVEKAKILREQRARATRRLKSVILIQSVYRCHQSNAKLRRTETEALRRKISDVTSLRKILKEKKGIDFIPPPATTTAMVLELLWLAKSIPYGKTTIRSMRGLSPDVGRLLEGLLENCLVPSVSAADDDANPLLSWVETLEGRRRLDSLLQLIVCVLLDIQSSDKCVQEISRFVHTVLRRPNSKSKRRAACLQHIREKLLPVGSREPVLPATREERRRSLTPFRCVETPLDLIAVTRYYLMFVSGGPDPIPDAAVASSRREKCITNKSRKRGGSMLQLVWDVVQGLPSQQARFFSFVWTVPLLSWKIPSETISYLIHTDDSAKLPLREMICAFIDDYTKSMQPGGITAFLPNQDAPLTACPATNTQCLLANLAQIGRICTAINGNDGMLIDFDFAVIFYDFVAVVLDAVPVMTFHSRESAVEWISDGKGHHTPVVISSVVLEQCRAFTMDSFVRRLFHCAIGTDYFETDKVLSTKTEEDVQLESDLSKAAGSSSVSLAANEAKIDRTKSFWSSSRWARRLTKNVANLLTSEGREKQKEGEGQSGLINSSTVSAKLARGEADAPDPSIVDVVAKRADFQPSLLYSLCRFYAIFLARWGGGGGSDTTGSSSRDTLQDSATSKPEAFTMSLLNVLSFATPIVRVSWGILQSDGHLKSSVARLSDADQGSQSIRTHHCLPALSSNARKKSTGHGDALSLLFVFVTCLCHALIVTDDMEIHDLGRPLPIHQLRRAIILLKKLLHKICCVDTKETSRSVPTYFGCALISSTARAMSDLYNRSSRRPLCLPKVWLIPDLLEKELRSCKTHGEYVALLSGTVLRVCPQLVSFKRRLKLFERIVNTNRINVQGENSPNPFHPNPLKRGRVAVIQRGRLLEDGLATMNNLGPNMRERITIHYVDASGRKEAGIDAGGLFKDFWTDLCKIAYDPNYVLFAVTEGAGNCLFPSPLSYSAHGIDHLTLFAFLGRIL